jgi:DNA-binding MarR family transcriptional regulator
MHAPPPVTMTTHDDVLDALLSASRALVAMAARSLADLDADVTLPQYRTLVILATRGPQRIADLAVELGVNPSTGTRMCDRLVRKGLASRSGTTTDRRVVRLTLTPAGRALIEQVTRRRREQLTATIAGIPQTDYAATVAALQAFARAAGEVPEREWSTGWTTSEPVTS